MDLCYICGCPLIELNNKTICPNHGIIEDNDKKEDLGRADYIG